MRTSPQKSRLLAALRALPRRAFGVLRAALVLAVLAGVVAMVFAQRAYGKVGEAALSVGRQLSGFEDLTGQSYRVRLNGQPVSVASTLTDSSVADVLSRFERHCKDGSVAGDELKVMADALVKHGSRAAGTEDTRVLRRTSENDGIVACLVRPSGGESLAARLARFAESMNLSDVGHLRYAFAKKTKGGRTHVIVAWTEGAFDVGALTAGGEKDAPGADIRGAARPKDSVRLLTAGVEGAPYGTWVYDSKAARDEVLSDLDRQMKSLGWTPIPGVAEEVGTGRAYSREGRDVMVFTHEGERSTVVSMIESRADH